MKRSLCSEERNTKLGAIVSLKRNSILREGVKEFLSGTASSSRDAFDVPRDVTTRLQFQRTIRILVIERIVSYRTSVIDANTRIMR